MACTAHSTKRCIDDITLVVSDRVTAECGGERRSISNVTVDLHQQMVMKFFGEDGQIVGKTERRVASCRLALPAQFIDKIAFICESSVQHRSPGSLVLGPCHFHVSAR